MVSETYDSLFIESLSLSLSYTFSLSLSYTHRLRYTKSPKQTSVGTRSEGEGPAPTGERRDRGRRVHGAKVRRNDSYCDVFLFTTSEKKEVDFIVGPLLSSCRIKGCSNELLGEGGDEGTDRPWSYREGGNVPSDPQRSRDHSFSVQEDSLPRFSCRLNPWVQGKPINGQDTDCGGGCGPLQGSRVAPASTKGEK